MTEFWKSTKKWHCKYCDIHINDDAPVSPVILADGELVVCALADVLIRS